MKMNKNQITMIAIGGVAAVAALAFGYLAFSARSECDETRESVAAERSNMRRLLSAPVPPRQFSLDKISANAGAYAAWRRDAHELLAHGDFELNRNVSATAFQDQMRRDASALAKLPGGVEGKIVRDGFDFGFKDYIVEGKIPPQAELPVLKRQWAEVKAMVEILAESGAVELLGVTAETVAPPPPPKEEPKRKGFGAKRPPKAPEPVKPPFEKMQYTLRFAARPVALVKVLNAFAASDHLMYVDDFAFARDKDMLGEMLGLGKKADDPAAGRAGRRGRRGRHEAEAAEGAGEEAQRKGLVTDPLVEAPFTVTLRVSTIDFGTNGAAGETAAKPAEPAAQEKEEAE